MLFYRTLGKDEAFGRSEGALFNTGYSTCGLYPLTSFMQAISGQVKNTN